MTNDTRRDSGEDADQRGPAAPGSKRKIPKKRSPGDVARDGKPADDAANNDTTESPASSGISSIGASTPAAPGPGLGAIGTGSSNT